MTLDQLRVFTAVAASGHVTRAAAELGMTQSAASAAIAALETRHGIALFDRIGRRIALSEAGRRFLPEAQAILDRATAAAAMLEDLSGLKTGRLSIAASLTIANYWLPGRIAAFSKQNPGIHLNVSMANTRQVETALLDGGADIGLVEGEIRAADLIRATVGHDQMALVLSAREDFADPGEWPFDLRRLPWVVREPGSGTRAALTDLAASQGLAFEDLHIALELPSNEAIRAAVEDGAGATLISRHVVAADLAAGRLRSVPVGLPPRAFTLVRHKKRFETAAQTALVRFLTA